MGITHMDHGTEHSGSDKEKEEDWWDSINNQRTSRPALPFSHPSMQERMDYIFSIQYLSWQQTQGPELNCELLILAPIFCCYFKGSFPRTLTCCEQHVLNKWHSHLRLPGLSLSNVSCNVVRRQATPHFLRRREKPIFSKTRKAGVWFSMPTWFILRMGKCS